MCHLLIRTMMHPHVYVMCWLGEALGRHSLWHLMCWQREWYIHPNMSCADRVNAPRHINAFLISYNSIGYTSPRLWPCVGHGVRYTFDRWTWNNLSCSMWPSCIRVKVLTHAISCMYIPCYRSGVNWPFRRD